MSVLGAGTGAFSLEESFQRGEETALVEMYRRFSAPMFAAAFSLLGSRELAAEAVQQAMVQAWRSSSSFDVSRELQPWLYAIVRRAAVDVWRRERRHEVLVEWDESLGLGVAGPSAESMWLAWQVRDGLAHLPVDEREVLRLAYFEQMTQSEIATALGVPLGTVKSRTSRAQRRLAGLLAHVRDAAPDSA